MLIYFKPESNEETVRHLCRRLNFENGDKR